MIEWISQPWHWAFSGFMIVVVMMLLLWFGGEFGVSSNLRTLCTIGGAGKKYSYFQFDWREEIWNLVFIVGAVIGGAIAVTVFASPEPVQISASTAQYLASVHIDTPTTVEEGLGYVPNEIFAIKNLGKPINLFLLIVGGFFIGFGTRWAGGCTSGHAISGLANLQIPSLIAVIGFFIGGLLMAWIILPRILSFLA